MPSVARWRRVLGQRAVYAFRYRPGDSLAELGITATRASTALQRDQNGIWQTANTNVLRDAHWQYDTLLGRSVRTLIREGASTNSALTSCDFSAATSLWSGSASWTLATAISCISGQTAYKHTNPGSAGISRFQNIGTFVNAQTDVSWVFLEEGTGPTARLEIYDVTAAAVCARATLTWSDLSIATAGTPAGSGVVRFGTGPNGGRLVLFYMAFTGIAAGTGGAGNTRRAYIYPTGVAADTTYAYLHHAQFEAATSYPSSPIVTVAGAVTRAADLISAPWSRNPEAGTFYIDCYDLGAYVTTNTRYWQIGATAAGTDPRLVLMANAGAYDSRYDNGVTERNQAAPTITGSYGARIEVRSILAGVGTIQTGASQNSGTEQVSGVSGVSALPAAWAAPARFYIGTAPDNSLPANLAIRSICYVPGPETSLAVLRQLAGT